jgi:hypothetical protein
MARNGPNGVQPWLNTERFRWEPDASTDLAPEPSAALYREATLRPGVRGVPGVVGDRDDAYDGQSEAVADAVASLAGVEEAVDLLGRDHRPSVRDGDDGLVAFRRGRVPRAAPEVRPRGRSDRATPPRSLRSVDPTAAGFADPLFGSSF